MAADRHAHQPVAVAASGTYRAHPSDNQDAYGVVRPLGANWCAALVADGVGSWADSGLASRAAVDAAESALTTAGDRAPTSIPEVFDAARRAVVDLAADDPHLEAGTTLLLGVATDQGMVFTAHVGNGAIFHVCRVPGAPHELGSPPPVHWVNAMLPHSGIQHGRDVLTSVLTTRSYDPPRPTHGAYQHDGHAAVVLVSDGIWTEEQVPVARSGDGRYWREIRPELRRLIMGVAELLDMRAAGAHELDLQQTFDVVMKEIIDHGVEDDATAAVILT